MNVRICFAVVLVFASCCLSGVFLEHLVKYSPGCGQLVTFSQFTFISLYGFIFVSKFGTKKSHIPLTHYASAVLLYFITTLASNMALGCHISVPVQMIFKSGSMLATLTLGVVILKRSYPLHKYVAVLMTTVGIALCLVINVHGKQQHNTTGGEEKHESLSLWLFGVALLTLSLFLGATLGIIQEKISLTYGKFPEEMLFYTHLLGLPAFVLFAKDILHQVEIFNSSPTSILPLIDIDIPSTWLLLLGNVVTQFLCIKSVYVLWTEMSALAVNVLLTFRKFVSLMLSIVYFQNPFTVGHWIGSCLVFGGTLLYSGVLNDIGGVIRKGEKVNKKEQ